MKYVDISNSFAAHPDNGNLLVRTGKGAIQQSLSNLLQTDLYEVPFKPNQGTKIRSLLFEQITQTTGRMIESLVREAVENNEPRVALEQVVVTPEPTRHRYIVTLVYYLRGEEVATTQNIIITRVR